MFIISQALNVVGGFMAIAKLLGWRPMDDAPELP
jgi:hypothetical protein